MTDDTPKTPVTTDKGKNTAAPAAKVDGELPPAQPGEIGGPRGPEPTRYGDWEKKGRCVDF